MGFFKMDKSWYRTHDMFLRKGSLITNYMIDRIENDENYSQIIKRLFRYMTVDPIAKKSLTYKGEDIIQPDLKDSLMSYTTEGTQSDLVDKEGKIITTKPCLFNKSFNQEMKISEQCFIFVHNYRNRPLQDERGEIFVRIDVVIPDKYDDIYDFDSGMTIKRGMAISFIIDDMLNNRTISDKKFSEYLGNIKFNLYDTYNARLTKTSDGIVYSLLYSLTTARGDIFNGNL